jgi:predicted N-acetyltransferase YhbS
VSTPGLAGRRRLDVVVRAAREEDLSRADALLRAAFDAFTGRTDHLRDGDPLHSRWRTGPERVVVAEFDGKVVGSNVITVRGTTGWFGPLSVDPQLWGRGIAHPLVDEAADLLRRAGAQQTGLFTFADSPLHLSLYARHGYWPGALMLVLARQARPTSPAPFGCYSRLRAEQQAALLRELTRLTEAVVPGWDLTGEAVGTCRAGLGDVVVVHDARGLAGAAVLQTGAGSDAASGTCRVKVAVVRLGPGADVRMTRLLEAVDAEALHRGAPTVVATVSAADEPCARLLLNRGHMIVTQGVAMHRGGVTHHRPGAWVLDDWR